MHLSAYCIPLDDPGTAGRVILFSTRTAACISLERSVLLDIEQNALPAAERDLLMELGFLVSSKESEQQEMLAYVDRMNSDITDLHLTVVMNLDCNLACPYCFEGNRKGKHFLSQQTADDLLHALETWLAERKNITVTFYGGEPLLSLPMIEQICRNVRTRAGANNGGFSVSLITNGTLLTGAVVDRLEPLGLISAYITLDGPRHLHDKSRPFRNGAGSFDTIIRNAGSVCDRIAVEIGGNYTREHFREFPSLLDALIDSGLGPERVASVVFNPVFNEEPRFAPDFHEGCRNMNEPWIAEAALFLRSETLSRGFRVPAVEPAVCMIERFDKLVVNWDGGLYKCTGLIGRPEYQVGTLRTGLADYRHSHDLGNWKNATCLSCSYLPLCFGGCRYFKLLRKGSFSGIECKRDFFDRALPGLVLQDMIRQGAAAH